jgi:SAM-dependent methyltransferase
VTDFAAVDVGDGAALIAMMDATDAWPAVSSARRWVLDRVRPSAGDVVVDVGCGLGTFGAGAAATGASAIDVDVSATMLDEVRRRRRGSLVVRADGHHLPLPSGVARVVHAERLLQWTADPSGALDELARAVAPDGWLAVTDTDWGTFAFDRPDPRAMDRWSEAALGWVPQPRFARGVGRACVALGLTEVHVRADAVVVTEWDPDDPAQRAGPPGLPLRSIAAGGAPSDHDLLRADLDAAADEARRGTFHALVALLSVLARVPAAE